MWWLLWVSEGVAAPAPTWPTTLDRVAPAVVSIQVTGVRNFDTENAGVSQGTGFVVDAERGWLLTNRHMVHAGPVVARAVFLDNEEVPLIAAYRDPVHDFGFYRFDPSLLKHMDVVELALSPGAARVGMEIRVVGNDAGEKLSILDGTLARLDRNAPAYGLDTYNDFNTFYYQAASNTSGGSSGSPVVDIAGRVVALNAGGATRAASSFYLPLERAVRALDLLRAGRAVPRGDVGVIFEHAPFHELERLGLSDGVEQHVRAAIPGATGLLVVAEVLPEGPGQRAGLLPGDVLVQIGGRDVTGFLDLEGVVDDAVDQKLSLVVERGGRRRSFDVPVRDLHAITPDRYVEFSRAVLHDVSLMVSRNHVRPQRGVFVATPGYELANAGVPANAVITHIDRAEVLNLDDAVDALAALPDGARVPVRWQKSSDPRHTVESVLRIDHRWHALRDCRRDDATGRWPCVTRETAEPAQVPPLPSPLPIDVPERHVRAVAPGLAVVEFDIPFPVAGAKDTHFVGVGAVVDADRGLLITDRDTVPVSLGDLTVTFAGTQRVPAKLVWLDPEHNVAMIRVDPAPFGGRLPGEVTFVDRDLAVDDDVIQVGIDGDHVVRWLETTIDDIRLLEQTPSRVPTFMETNVDLVELESKVTTHGGVLLDKRGRVVALHASFYEPEGDERRFFGLPSAVFLHAIEALRAGDSPGGGSVGFDVGAVSLAHAAERGVDSAHLADLRDLRGDRGVVYEVVRREGGSAAAEVLRDGDLLLEVDGAPLTDIGLLDDARRRGSFQLVVVRDGLPVVVSLSPVARSGAGVERVVNWAGLVLHEAHPEVARQQAMPPGGVVVSWMWYGSPASRGGMRSSRRLIALGDTPVPTLDALIAAIVAHDPGEPVRLRVQKIDGSEDVSTFRLDPDFWPTFTLTETAAGWVREDLP